MTSRKAAIKKRIQKQLQALNIAEQDAMKFDAVLIPHYKKLLKSYQALGDLDGQRRYQRKLCDLLEARLTTFSPVLVPHYIGMLKIWRHGCVHFYPAVYLERLLIIANMLPDVPQQKVNHTCQLLMPLLRTMTYDYAPVSAFEQLEKRKELQGDALLVGYAFIYHGFAKIYAKKRDTKNAELYYQKAIAAGEQEGKMSYTDLVDIYKTYAIWLFSDKKRELAMPFVHKGIALELKINGKKSLDLWQFYWMASHYHEGFGEYQEVLDYQRKLEVVYKNNLYREPYVHPEDVRQVAAVDRDKFEFEDQFINTNHKIARAAWKLGQFKRSLSLIEDNLQYLQLHYPENVRRIANHHNELTEIYRAMGNFKMAFRTNKIAFMLVESGMDDLEETIANEEYYTTDIEFVRVEITHQLASNHYAIGNYETAIIYWKETEKLRQIGFNTNSVKMTPFHGFFAQAYFNIGNYAEALKAWQEAIEDEHYLQKDDPLVQLAYYEQVANCYHLLGSTALADDTIDKALNIKLPNRPKSDELVASIQALRVRIQEDFRDSYEEE